MKPLKEILSSPLTAYDHMMEKMGYPYDSANPSDCIISVPYIWSVRGDIEEKLRSDPDTAYRIGLEFAMRLYSWSNQVTPLQAGQKDHPLSQIESFIQTYLP